jgi:hypothetical protein
VSLTTHIRNKTHIYDQLVQNTDLSNVEKLLSTSYEVICKPPEATIYQLVGMGVIYALREYLFGTNAIHNTIAGKIAYTPNFGDLAVDALCNAMRDSFARKQRHVEKGMVLNPDIEPSVRDLQNIVSTFGEVFAQDLPFTFSNFHVNPTFTLSRLLGGADANFIIGNTIFQVITTGKTHPLTLEKVLQPIGYHMADLHNEYAITHVCWYFSRHKQIVSESLATLMWDVRKKFEIQQRINHGNQQQWSYLTDGS